MISRFAALFVALFFSGHAVFAATACGDLRSLSDPGMRVAAAELVPAGSPAPTAFPAAPAGKAATSATTLPAYCRVAAVLTPSADSHIEMELWLPTETWNGKFQAVGGGGWAGGLSLPAMATALGEGYATASNDTGHKGGDALFGIGHPEKVVDYAYRAVHEMTVRSKSLIEAFYGEKARLSYWNGCSTGGRQGLMEAQRYPEDYDAIVAGAPANYHSHLHVADLALTVPVMGDDALKVPADKLDLLNRAVLDACDALDGVKDGLLQDPKRCRFDPAALRCAGGDAPGCLTAGQVETLKRAYAPVTTASGAVVFPGKAHGGEYAWSMLSGAQPSPVSVGTMLLTTQDAKWDWRTFDLERDLAAADAKTGFINAIDPDLGAFQARGGKLLLYHGWDDMGIAPENTVNYYEQAKSETGAQPDRWMRLFMLPGVGHCSGGRGPDQADFMGALERWVEAGEAPERVIAHRVSGGRVVMSRPLCPYPQVARYKGVGSANDAANFECKAP
ncbi:MAG: tannase/feruloyl esterase family alpha/beta hydrolase [Acidobacteriota bacterium]|jgi:feruloyl esterase|nr:tannase/feruloyl esterase family alpha/beta hydrolase [Acidobacteriota bacterium]